MGLKYYSDMNDAPVSDLLLQAIIKTENQLMSLSAYSCKYRPDTGSSTEACIIFYQGGKIDYGKHIPGPVPKYSAESEYNAVCTARMALAHPRMLNHELLKKDLYIVTNEGPRIILHSKYAVCMSNNGKDNKHTRHICKDIKFCTEW